MTGHTVQKTNPQNNMKEIQMLSYTTRNHLKTQKKCEIEKCNQLFWYMFVNWQSSSPILNDLGLCSSTKGAIYQPRGDFL